jgi:hypothetical protein
MSSNLNRDLVRIGMRLSLPGSAVAKNGNADIEDTLIRAIIRFPEDHRLASLVFSWIKVHGAYVIVEKLRKTAERRYPKKEFPEIRWVSAVAAFAADSCSHKWRKLAKRSSVPVYLFPQDVTESAVALKGNIPWLKKLNFVVPASALRIRDDDVLSPEKLIETNAQYRNRYLFGPSWRADIITAIQQGMKTPSEIAKGIGCSYEPAYRVFHEYMLVAGAL